MARNWCRFERRGAAGADWILYEQRKIAPRSMFSPRRKPLVRCQCFLTFECEKADVSVRLAEVTHMCAGWIVVLKSWLGWYDEARRWDAVREEGSFELVDVNHEQFFSGFAQ